MGNTYTVGLNLRMAFSFQKVGFKTMLTEFMSKVAFNDVKREVKDPLIEKAAEELAPLESVLRNVVAVLIDLNLEFSFEEGSADHPVINYRTTHPYFTIERMKVGNINFNPPAMEQGDKFLSTDFRMNDGVCFEHHAVTVNNTRVVYKTNLLGELIERAPLARATLPNRTTPVGDTLSNQQLAELLDSYVLHQVNEIPLVGDGCSIRLMQTIKQRLRNEPASDLLFPKPTMPMLFATGFGPSSARQQMFEGHRNNTELNSESATRGVLTGMESEARFFPAITFTLDKELRLRFGPQVCSAILKDSPNPPPPQLLSSMLDKLEKTGFFQAMKENKYLPTSDTLVHINLEGEQLWRIYWLDEQKELHQIKRSFPLGVLKKINVVVSVPINDISPETIYARYRQAVTAALQEKTNDTPEEFYCTRLFNMELDMRFASKDFGEWLKVRRTFIVTIDPSAKKAVIHDALGEVYTPQ